MIIYVIGLLAQLFFSSRILVQWVMSERQKKIVSPTLFWVLSMMGSYLLFIYGWLRDDFSILLGQVISYYIYIWNLNLKGYWSTLPLPLRAVLLGTPWLAVGIVMRDFDAFMQQFFLQDDIPLWMIVMGSAGQVIFTLRFVYQWVMTLRTKKADLPIGFWVFSLLGSSIIISYAILRRDPILIIGQSFGFIAYTRNVILGVQHARNS